MFWEFFTSSALLAGYHVVKCDPDLEERESGQDVTVSYRAAAITYYRWTGIVVAVIIFVVLLCLVLSWLYSCRMRRRNSQNSRSGQSRSSNLPKISVLEPPSYISHDPPSYSAPDFFKINAENLNHLQLKPDHNKKSRRERLQTTIFGNPNNSTQNSNSTAQIPPPFTYSNDVALDEPIAWPGTSSQPNPATPPPAFVANGEESTVVLSTSCVQPDLPPPYQRESPARTSQSDIVENTSGGNRETCTEQTGDVITERETTAL